MILKLQCIQVCFRESFAFNLLTVKLDTPLSGERYTGMGKGLPYALVQRGTIRIGHVIKGCTASMGTVAAERQAWTARQSKESVPRLSMISQGQ